MKLISENEILETVKIDGDGDGEELGKSKKV